MTSPMRRTASSSSPHTAAPSTRGPRTSPPPSTAATFRTPSTLRAATNPSTYTAASPHTAAASPLSAQQQQHLSDKVRVNGYLCDRWLTEDNSIEVLLADKQWTADSVAVLRQQALDEQWDG